MSIARAKAFDVLVVREIDRLSRSLAKQLIVEEELKRNGVTIEYVLGDYANTPEGDLMKNVKGVISEYERLKIVERNTRGKRLAVQAGRVIGTKTRPPYGFTYDDKHKLVILESEASTVRDIYGLYLSGESAYRIVDRLTEAGIPCPSVGKAGYNRTNGDTLWNKTSVIRILASDLYCGVWRYGRKKYTGKTAYTLRDIDDTFAVEVPAIVSPKVWQAAQERREYNAKMSKRNKRTEYLLAGRVHCACTHLMTGVSKPSGSAYYRCNASAEPHKTQDEKTCNAKSVRRDLVDSLAWEFIKNTMQNRVLFIRMLEEARDSEANQLVPKHDRLSACESLIAKSEKRSKSLVLSISHFDDDDDSRTVLEAELKEIRKTIGKLSKERDNLLADIQSAKPLTNDDIEETMREFDQLQSDLDGADFTKRRWWVGRLDVTCVVESPEKVYLRGRYPIKENVTAVGSYQSPEYSYANYLGHHPGPSLSQRIVDPEHIISDTLQNTSVPTAV